MQFTWIRHCHITVITVTSHERHGASNHRPLDGWFNNLFQASIKLKASKLRSNSPLSWESADDRWIPLREGQHYRMRVHAMTSSWRCNDYFMNYVMNQSWCVHRIGILVLACIVPYIVVLELIYLVSHPLLNIVVNMQHETWWDNKWLELIMRIQFVPSRRYWFYLILLWNIV